MATILIVDDLAANRRALVAMLATSGHRVLEAADGSQGLASVRAEHPDLVITDVLMPVMDGYEFVRQLRRDPTTSRIPVLFYTPPYGSREARTQAQASGAFVLTKSAGPAEVSRIIEHLLTGASALPADDADVPPDDREQLRLLTDTVTEQSGDLRTANVRLRALVNIGLQLSSQADPAQLLQSVCSSACDLFGATYVTLGIVDRASGVVRHFVTCGIDVEAWRAPGSTVDGVLARVIAERRTFRAENPDGDPARLDLPAGHPDVQSMLAVPITSPMHVYGWICLVCNDGGAFSDSDEDMVVALAAQVGRVYELEHQILERQDAESALRTTEERLRFALEAAGVGVWDMDFTTGALSWSDRLEAQYGLIPGTFDGTFPGFIARVHPQDRDALMAVMEEANRTGTDFQVQHRTIWPDGTIHWLNGAGRIRLDEAGAPRRGLGISIDITARHELEAQYLQAQKMEAVGQLAGGVAHDFNNLLTAILGYCSLLLADPDPGDPRTADIAEIQKAGESAARLTRQLLAFSRKQVIEPTIFDLNEVVMEMRPMLGRLIREDITVALTLRPETARLKADRGQMEQIIMNLAVNARDAMPSGGTLSIETANTMLDAEYAALHPGVKPGPYVALTVSDTGVGMSADVQARLFEPFFTTKALGQGTGLGMATVSGIVERIGGSVNVYSELGQGTVMKVYLPSALAIEPALAPAAPPPAPRAAHETILVVEDSELLRALIRRLLERKGYTVVLAGSADEALTLFDQNGAIDLLLTDVVMPGGSGSDLGSRLLERRPGLKVLYMSGYTEDTITRQGVLMPGIAFLNKPFTSQALGQKLDEVLGGRPVEPAGPVRRAS